jgi:hypothetical protein
MSFRGTATSCTGEQRIYKFRLPLRVAAKIIEVCITLTQHRAKVIPLGAIAINGLCVFLFLFYVAISYLNAKFLSMRIRLDQL